MTRRHAGEISTWLTKLSEDWLQWTAAVPNTGLLDLLHSKSSAFASRPSYVKKMFCVVFSLHPHLPLSFSFCAPKRNLAVFCRSAQGVHMSCSQIQHCFSREELSFPASPPPMSPSSPASPPPPMSLSSPASPTPPMSPSSPASPPPPMSPSSLASPTPPMSPTSLVVWWLL